MLYFTAGSHTHTHTHTHIHTHTHTHNSLTHTHIHTHTHTEPPDDGDPCAICFEIQPGDEWCESVYIAPHEALDYLCMRV
jgi:hypothetical protein